MANDPTAAELAELEGWPYSADLTPTQAWVLLSTARAFAAWWANDQQGDWDE